jgi:hypothetical protein
MDSRSCALAHTGTAAALGDGDDAGVAEGLGDVVSVVGDAAGSDATLGALGPP